MNMVEPAELRAERERHGVEIGRGVRAGRDVAGQRHERTALPAEPPCRAGTWWRRRILRQDGVEVEAGAADDLLDLIYVGPGPVVQLLHDLAVDALDLGDAGLEVSDPHLRDLSVLLHAVALAGNRMEFALGEVELGFGLGGPGERDLELALELRHASRQGGALGGDLLLLGLDRGELAAKPGDVLLERAILAPHASDGLLEL